MQPMKFGLPRRARSDQIAQPHERRMVQEILVHADRRTGLRGSLEQRRALRAARGERLLHQHRLAGSQQRQGRVAMHRWWHQNVGAIERIGRERVFDRPEYLRRTAGPARLAAAS